MVVVEKDGDMTFSADDATRVARAAVISGWSIGVVSPHELMATRDGDPVGFPRVVRCRKKGGLWVLWLYESGDDVSGEGVVVGELTGGARDCGRALRDVLAGLGHDEGAT
jgi:hypothetical protein